LNDRLYSFNERSFNWENGDGRWDLPGRNDTDQLIRETAIELFGSKGFEGTGVRDIARDVGLTPGALYHYMGSKQDLLVAIMHDGNSRMMERAEAALAEAGDDPAERLAALVANHVRIHCEAPLEAQVNDYELRSLTAANRRSIVKLRNSYESLWATELQCGVEAGVFKLVDVKVCRLSLLQMCTGVANWYSGEGPLTMGEVVDRMVALALQLVGCAKPVEQRRIVALDGGAAAAGEAGATG
jgi:AcrR family transcriptional regulator